MKMLPFIGNKLFVLRDNFVCVQIKISSDITDPVTNGISILKRQEFRFYLLCFSFVFHVFHRIFLLVKKAKVRFSGDCLFYIFQSSTYAASNMPYTSSI